MHFASSGVEIAVVETGLGGRFDATNALAPVVSVITSIGIDHTEFLGTSVEQIAFEKAGIIKPRVQVVIGPALRPDGSPGIPPRAMEVLLRTARQRHSTVIMAGESVRVSVTDQSLAGVRCTVALGGKRREKVLLPLAGLHQASNLSTALTALLATARRVGLPEIIAPANIRRGLAEVQTLAGIAGRLQLLGYSPSGQEARTGPKGLHGPARRKRVPVILDVGHNPDGVRAAAASLGALLPGRRTVTVLGVMKDKDAPAMIRALGAVSRTIVCVAPRTERALDAGSLARLCRESGVRAVAALSVEGGIGMALAEIRPDEALLIIGSHYLAAEAVDSLDFGSTLSYFMQG
jgi:dihydrofolate synthase/folylpolyglutamate synthase